MDAKIRRIINECVRMEINEHTNTPEAAEEYRSRTKIENKVMDGEIDPEDLLNGVFQLMRSHGIKCSEFEGILAKMGALVDDEYGEEEF